MRLWRGALGVAAAIPLAFLALFFLWPVASLVATGLGGGIVTPEGGIFSVLSNPRTGRVIGQTLAQAGAGTALSVVLGLPAAFALYRIRFVGQTVIRGLLTVPFVLPTVVVGVAFQSLFGPGGMLFGLGLDQSFTAIVLALAFFNVTLVARIVGGFWQSLDERPEQAARMLGASPLRAWASVTLPRLLPAIGSAAALVFLFCATAFGVVLVLGGKQFSNIETEIYGLTMQFLDLQGAAVLSLVQAVIVIITLMVSARLRTRYSAGERRTSGTARLERAGRKHAAVLTVFAVTVLTLHVLPILSLGVRSLRRSDGSLTFDHYRFLVDPPEESPLATTVFEALWVSVRFALLAALLAMVLGTLIALVLSRRPRSTPAKRAQGAYEMFVMMPLGVSAVTLGLGLLLTMHNPLGLGIDLRSSTALIPVAQTLVALPLVIRTMLPVLRSVSPRQLDAATLLGASPARVFRTIELPALSRAFGLSIGFAFATSLGEFGATSFLVRSGSETLPVVISQLVSHQAASSYGTGLAAAMVLGLATSVVMLLAEGWRVTEHAGGW
ncbi:iron ABC transporter permease [Leucobacter sp. UCMA 4100]|uniref:ABC transporter permease n=1 Tax=Leucobacter sp. UCMA 4100 TaxID=2810534 RepID=UPI0022EB41E5|nr:iron ABC transporter permease [Leucobacter sp. UCMA 4100]MDA3146155.1 iron ABC transporter permease [Leucobacter sp. UCMA 4100]